MAVYTKIKTNARSWFEMNERTVVKKAEAKKRVFKGVNLDSLAVGEKSMVTKMNYIAGNYATEHPPPRLSEN